MNSILNLRLLHSFYSNINIKILSIIRVFPKLQSNLLLMMILQLKFKDQSQNNELAILQLSIIDIDDSFEKQEEEAGKVQEADLILLNIQYFDALSRDNE